MEHLNIESGGWKLFEGYSRKDFSDALSTYNVNEPIPKLKIASLNLEFGIIKEFSDHEK
jgi:hypothetical protein